MSSFFPELILFFGTYTFFRHNVWLEKTKYEFLFFWNSIFWSLMFGPKKVWGPFFWNSYFFGTHTFIGTMFGTKKYEFLFFGFFFGTHTFFCWNLGTHTFFDVMFGPKKYESCPFPELLVFFAVIFWWTKCLDFSEMPFFPEHLTLNTFVVELCLFLRIKAFIL